MPKILKTKLKPAINNCHEMETLVREIADLKFDEQQLAAGLDAALRRVREEYEVPLGEVTRALAEKTGAAREWAEANAAAFGGRRSMEFVHGVAGFRVGQPKLKTVAKRKWEGVLDALRALPWGTAYIRVKEEINKEQIIADISGGFLQPADLRAAGAQVVQEELFYVEPKLTRVDLRETAKAA
jgi:phage host-nuclease inhibitor protein Gam